MIEASEVFLSLIDKLDYLRDKFKFIDCPECYAEPEVYNTIKLEELPDIVRQAVEEGKMRVYLAGYKPTIHREDCKIGLALSK